MSTSKQEMAFFPGCSLATSARENYDSLQAFCRYLGYELKEVEDWNCCGTSSAHAVNSELAFDLACRDLALMHRFDQVLVACPSCYKRLQHTFHLLTTNSQLRTIFEKKWKTTFNPHLRLLPFLRFLAQQDLTSHYGHAFHSLQGLRVVSYYGCMLSYPPNMNKDPQLYGIMEKIMKELGAEPIMWSHSLKCCGTFLSVARPDIATPLVNDIFSAAIKVGAQCLVTACSMCHLNLEVRCTIRPALPVFHFSELLALALGSGPEKDWFNRHLYDPRPLLRSIGFYV